MTYKQYTCSSPFAERIDEQPDKYGVDVLEKNYPWYLATALALVCHGFSMAVLLPWLF